MSDTAGRTGQRASSPFRGTEIPRTCALPSSASSTTPSEIAADLVRRAREALGRTTRGQRHRTAASGRAHRHRRRDGTSWPSGSIRTESATTTRPPPAWSPKPQEPGADTPRRPHTVNRSGVPSLRDQKAQLTETRQARCEALLHRHGISSHKDVLAQRGSTGDEGPRLPPLRHPLGVDLDQHRYSLSSQRFHDRDDVHRHSPVPRRYARHRTNIRTPGRTLDTARFTRSDQPAPAAAPSECSGVGVTPRALHQILAPESVAYGAVQVPPVGAPDGLQDSMCRLFRAAAPPGPAKGQRCGCLTVGVVRGRVLRPGGGIDRLRLPARDPEHLQVPRQVTTASVPAHGRRDHRPWSRGRVPPGAAPGCALRPRPCGRRGNPERTGDVPVREAVGRESGDQYGADSGSAWSARRSASSSSVRVGWSSRMATSQAACRSSSDRRSKRSAAGQGARRISSATATFHVHRSLRTALPTGSAGRQAPGRTTFYAARSFGRTSTAGTPDAVGAPRPGGTPLRGRADRRVQACPGSRPRAVAVSCPPQPCGVRHRTWTPKTS